MWSIILVDVISQTLPLEKGKTIIFRTLQYQNYRYHKTPDQSLERAKKRYSNDPSLLQKSKEAYKKNPQPGRQRALQYYHANRRAEKARIKCWLRKHPDVRRMTNIKHWRRRRPLREFIVTQSEVTSCLQEQRETVDWNDSQEKLCPPLIRNSKG